MLIPDPMDFVDILYEVGAIQAKHECAEHRPVDKLNPGSEPVDREDCDGCKVDDEVCEQLTDWMRRTIGEKFDRVATLALDVYSSESYRVEWERRNAAIWLDSEELQRTKLREVCLDLGVKPSDLDRIDFNWREAVSRLEESREDGSGVAA